MKKYDYIIIGGGIIGSFIAYELSHYNLKVALLEKNNEILNETSSANSAIIHAGYDPVDGSLKASLNVKGHQKYAELCRLLKVPYKEIGSLIVGYNNDDIAILNELHSKAIKRNIETKLLNSDEISDLEPSLNRPLMALYSPTTAIISPWLTGIALIEDALYNGLELYLNNEVQSIEYIADEYHIKTNDDIYISKAIINCAGLYATNINEMVGLASSVQIKYRRGEYFVLDKNALDIKHVIYPTPNKLGKGVLIVPTVDNNILLGPNATEVSQPDENQTTIDGLNEVRTKIGMYLNNVPFDQTIRTFAGIRPTATNEDFNVEMEPINDFYSYIGIDSPGLASAPALASMLVDYLIDNKHITRKKEYNLYPSKLDYLHQADKEKRYELNHKYAKIICRCEKISEQEIVDAITSIYPSLSVKAIKKRLRPQMGRCQGGFCQPKILNLLSKHTNHPLDEINYDELNTNILIKRGANHD